ncbi:YlbF family regulator [Bacillus marinisedimentorum]|uniref:YlbF family regulator n=1 Tax=Bacillus marinisedimentorum TaxID=1821260 RepID=UPI0007E1F717|nr:YlbF family regulator [Bacillus marinisedimentorum]
MYDAAYDLEKEIRDSEDFKQLKEVYDKINSDEVTKRMFDNFRNIQLTLQEKQMRGEEITEEEVAQAQQTVQLVQQHEEINKLMEAEQRVSMLLNDINKIIMKPLEDLYGTAEEDAPNEQ